MTILFMLDIFVYIPIQFFMIFRCGSIINANHTQKQNGYPQLAKLINIFGIIFILTVHPQMLLTLPIDHTHPNLCNNLLLSCHISGLIIETILISVALSRFWLIYYDANILNSLIRNQWKIYLNSTCVKMDLWFKYRNKWGNRIFIAKFMAVICIVSTVTYCFVIYYVLTYIDNDAMDKTNTFLYLIPVVCGSTIYFSISNISSKHKYERNNPMLLSLKHELKIFVFVIVTGIVIALINEHTGIYDVDDLSNLDRNTRSIQRFLQLGPYAFAIVILCLSTIRSATCMYDEGDSGHGKIKEYSLVRNESDESNMEMQKQIKLKQILCNEHEMERFIQYLCQKFQLNTILCFIELIQFKYLLDGLFDISLNRNRYTLGTIMENESTEYESKVNDNYYERCVLSVICESEIIPRSDIVYALNINDRFDEKKIEIMKECLKIAHTLYGKYIESNSHQSGDKLVVDISYTLKKCYDFDMGISTKEFLEKHCEDTFEDLFEHFDPVIDEMYVKLNRLCQDYEQFH